MKVCWSLKYKKLNEVPIVSSIHLKKVGLEGNFALKSVSFKDLLHKNAQIKGDKEPHAITYPIYESKIFFYINTSVFV